MIKHLFHTRVVYILLFLGLVGDTHAAHLRVFGLVTDDTGSTPLAGVTIKIYKDGERLPIAYTDNNGKYNVSLENNASYVLRFVHAGHVTKCFSVDTHGGEWEGDGKSVSLEVGIKLFEPVSGMDFSFFDLPMGMARFTPLNGQIIWSKEYESRVAPQVQRLMTERASRLAHQLNVATATSSKR